MMFVLFGTTFAFSTWGGGRPMMITFVFTSVFAVVGAGSVGKLLAEFLRKLRVLHPSRNKLYTFIQAGAIIMAPLLIALLILSSGVASELFLGGEAPSNVPSVSETIDTGKEADITMHVWFLEHQNGGQAWGDPTTKGHTDWYLPSIESRTDGNLDYFSAAVSLPKGDLVEIRQKGIEPGYILLTSHNTKNSIIKGGIDSKDYSLNEFDEELDNRHSIYDSKYDLIYYWPIEKKYTHG